MIIFSIIEFWVASSTKKLQHHRTTLAETRLRYGGCLFLAWSSTTIWRLPITGRAPSTQFLFLGAGSPSPPAWKDDSVHSWPFLALPTLWPSLYLSYRWRSCWGPLSCLGSWLLSHALHIIFVGLPGVFSGWSSPSLIFLGMAGEILPQAPCLNLSSSLTPKLYIQIVFLSIPEVSFKPDCVKNFAGKRLGLWSRSGAPSSFSSLHSFETHILLDAAGNTPFLFWRRYDCLPNGFAPPVIWLHLVFNEGSTTSGATKSTQGFSESTGNQEDPFPDSYVCVVHLLLTLFCTYPSLPMYT